MRNSDRVAFLLSAARLLVLAWMGSAPLSADSPPARPTPVRYPEGLVHGYLALRTLEGEALASGDLIQTARGDQVTSRLVFRFKDGSSHDETAVFNQGRQFRLARYKLVQKGPAFEHPLELSIDPKRGRVTVRHTDDEGKEKVESEHMDLPPDLANGIVPILLKNGRPESPPTMHFLAATPKPRLVKLEATAAGEASFRVAGSTHKAIHYVVKVEIGGIAGFMAPIVGKQPPDTHVWIEGGDAPAFVRSEGPLSMGGPPWRIDLTGPAWPEAPAGDGRR
jgi:hypothetical protein